MPEFKFAQNPFIRTIAEIPKWTISVQFGDKKKVPANISDLMYNNHLSGGNIADTESTTTLTKIDDFFKAYGASVRNHCFYVNTVTDGFCVLDIEPECPKELMEKFTHFAYLYGEISMSGKGRHLIFPVPQELLLKYPAAAKKVAMKGENNWYEILMQHWCTFTANPLPPSDNADPFGFMKLFEELAAKQVDAEIKLLDIDSLNEVDLPKADRMLELLDEASKYWKKQPSDYDNDLSRYEYHYMLYLYGKMEHLMHTGVFDGIKYSDSDKAWFLYTTARNVLPYRAKHSETRDGLPWLLYQARAAMSYIDSAQKAKEEEKLQKLSDAISDKKGENT